MKKIVTQSEIRKIISANDINQLRDYLKIKPEQDLLKLLLDYLAKMLNNFELSYRSVIYKVLGFIEELAVLDESNLMSKCSVISTLREDLISEIKVVDKKSRTDDKKIIFFKDIVNRLENLELNITYNMKSPLILANYNIVKYIIFDMKDINCSKDLIRNNAHLINAFNMNSEDIFNLLIEDYIRAVDSHVKEEGSYDLFYYDEVISELLKIDKIKKDDAVIERIIQRIIDLDKTRNKTCRETQKARYWYRHIVNMLDNINYKDDLNSLNNMYNVNFYFKNNVILDGYEKGSTLSDFKLDKTSGIITIDDLTVHERDDALSIEKVEDDLYSLKIYIADPNSLYGMDSPVMMDARKRVETLYLDNPVGMFPEEIVKNFLSLDVGNQRLVREYSFLVSSSGIIEDFKITKKFVNIDKNYTYDEFNQMLKEPMSFEEEDMVQNLVELKNIINKKYISDSMVEQYNSGMTKSENLIETYMIFLNSKLAEFFSSRGIPFVYRYHPHSRNIDNTNINLNSLPENNRKEYKKIIKNMEKLGISAKYSVDKKSHEGLALPFYCHSSSPLRRYADILVNECEDKFYFDRCSDKEAYLFEDYLKGEVDYINDRIIGLEKYLSEYESAKGRARTR